MAKRHQRPRRDGLASKTLPASTGITASYREDAANRLMSVVYQQNGATLAQALSTLDANGKPTPSSGGCRAGR